MIHEGARKLPKDKFIRLVSSLGKQSVYQQEPESGQTALHVACDANRQEIVALLLDKYHVRLALILLCGFTAA
jgi:hypothetical protein